MTNTSPYHWEQDAADATLTFIELRREPRPFEDMTLAEVVTQVLTERQPMKVLDLVSAMMEAGYQTPVNRRHLRNAVIAVLRKGKRFRDVDGEWGIV